MSNSPGRGDRCRMIDRIDRGDTVVATNSLLELTYFETDVAWLEEFLSRQARENSDGNVRQLAVTCIGHSARINRTVSSDSVYRSLRGFIMDPQLCERALNALSDIDVFTGRHWASAQWIMLQVAAMTVRLRAGDTRFWMS
ncbi:hypothetical protein [Promicromonospora umidemergens]|uniref:HEAT repeat protein n=1 Tax=Promicromonospora umidemergens TaxID=629679 RepID=A0ABP8WRC3_9MICO|nr:hypothetical protein [Promicromonospora umidemergens]